MSQLPLLYPRQWMRMFAKPGRLGVNPVDEKDEDPGTPVQAFPTDLSVGAAQPETARVDRCLFQAANNKNLGSLRCRDFVER